jgi:hypothetical protein
VALRASVRPPHAAWLRRYGSTLTF